ncbi:uncharacterized protein [Battus philenor]|uniref:uncharacterized protein isoform X2 n=1 Tax=Battus philenor TaxID=42288 RepID=UPI0035D03BC6
MNFTPELTAFQGVILSADNINSFSNLTARGAACYKQICRLNFFNVNINLINLAFNVFQKCLKYFSSPPNLGRLEGLNQNQLYRYIGESLYKLLLLLYECFEEFHSTQTFQLHKDINIYMLTYNEESVNNKIDIKTAESKDEVSECLNKCHEALLDVSKELVMGVSVDIFCTWCEFEEKGKNMQQTIGELCYKLRNRLVNSESVANHPLVEMLTQISCKPVEVSDIINTTSTAVIIENIENDLDKSLWIQGLLKKNDICQDLSLVKTLTSNLNFLKEDDFFNLYNICIGHLNNFTENEEAVKLLAIKTFQFCDIETKHNIIKNTFTQNCFSDELETVEFNNMMTEIFNKLIATPDEDLSIILTIFIQSPQKVYQKIFYLATENAQQCLIMGSIMKYLSKYSNFYYTQDTEACVIRTAQNIIAHDLDSEKRQKHFINFMKLMKTDNIIPGAKILLLIIMPNLHEAMLHMKLINIHIHINMLTKIYDLKELVEYRAPMLAMMAQVLDVVRWKIHTFNALSPSCLELAIELQTSIINTYETNIPEKELLWLKSKLRKKNPFNMYYYRILFTPSGVTYLETLTGLHVNEGVDVNKLTFCMSKILCSTILNEWYLLWESMSMFNNTEKIDIFHNALVLISTAEKNNHTAVTWACLLHCYRNFLQLMRYKYISEPVRDQQVIAVVAKIVKLVNAIDDTDIEEFQSLSLPLLGYIAERRNDYTINIPNFIGDSIKSPTFACLIQNIFMMDTT